MNTMDFETDRKKEIRLDTVIDYFKLLYIEKLTHKENYSAFKMINGEKIFNKVLEANKEGYISLTDTNFQLLYSLNSLLETVSKQSHSLSYNEQFYELDWLKEIVSVIPEQDKACDTIIDMSSNEVFIKIIKPALENMTIKNQDKCVNMDRVSKILEVAKKNK